MSKRSEQIYDDLLVEYADEHLQVKIDNDLLKDLKINKAALTRFANRWIEQKRAKWIGTSTLQLIYKVDEGSDENINDEEITGEEINDEGQQIDKGIELDLKNKTKSELLSSMPNLNVAISHIDLIIDLIERKFNTKLTREMQNKIRNNILTIDTWEKTLKNITYQSVPDKIIEEYINFITTKY